MSLLMLEIAADLSVQGFDVLLDDRDARTGEKLGDAISLVSQCAW